jgi:hypothetical protein
MGVYWYRILHAETPVTERCHGWILVLCTCLGAYKIGRYACIREADNLDKSSDKSEVLHSLLSADTLPPGCADRNWSCCATGMGGDCV